MRWITSTLVVVLVLETGAAAQSAKNREAGVFGGRSAESQLAEIDNCVAPEGLSEQETDARVSEHYDRATALYEQGDYTGAIEEFVAAYCYGKYASILRDIGQSYERLLDYERAVAYYDRYILEAPDDEQQLREMMSYRVEVLRNLPARIRVATVPESATVTITGPTGVVAQAPANADTLVVPKGSYKMKVELPGYEPVEQPIVAEIGQPYSYYFQLQPQRGRVRITSAPSSARIFVDDKLVGVGSYNDTLPIGKYDVTVEASNRTPKTKEFEIFANRPTNVSVELDERPRSGRRELMIASTIGGGVFGGASFTTIFDQGTTGSTLGGLLGLGVGFGGAYFGISDDISVGDSSFVIGSTVIGAAEGGLITTLIKCSHDDETDDVDCGGGGTIGGVALASGVAGLGFAAATTGRFDFTAGDAAMINSGAMWGATGGALFWALFDQPGDRPKLGATLTLLGMNAGIVAGGTLAARTDYSRGHVALIDMSGLAGIIGGVALANAFPEDDTGASERVEHFALGGMTVGLITGAYLTRNRSKPKSLSKVRANLDTVHDSAGNPVTTAGFGFDF